MTDYRDARMRLTWAFRPTRALGPRRGSPFGNSCNDIRRQKSVLRRPSSVLCRISNHPRSSSDPPQFNKLGYVGPVGTTNAYMIGTDDALERTRPGRAGPLVWARDARAQMAPLA